MFTGDRLQSRLHSHTRACFRQKLGRHISNFIMPDGRKPSFRAGEYMLDLKRKATGTGRRSTRRDQSYLRAMASQLQLSCM